MAQYNIRFSCGHEETRDLYGKTCERENKIAYFEKYGVCTKCYIDMCNAENAEGCKEVEMKYTDYIRNYKDCKTKGGSYNGETKTIVVYVPKEITDVTNTYEITKLSKWITLRTFYNADKNDSLYDYYVDSNGNTPSSENFDKNDSVLIFFTFKDRKYALNMFVPLSPIEFVEKGNLHIIEGVYKDGDNSIYIEADAKGENVRLFSIKRIDEKSK